MRPPEDKAGDGQDEVPGTGTGGGTAGPGQRGDIGERYRARKREFLDVGLSCLPDEEFIEAVRQAVETRSPLTISFINPDYVLRGHLAERVYWYPPWALKLPLAWAYRLTREPGRL